MALFVVLVIWRCLLPKTPPLFEIQAKRPSAASPTISFAFLFEESWEWRWFWGPGDGGSLIRTSSTNGLLSGIASLAACRVAKRSLVLQGRVAPIYVFWKRVT